MIIFSDENITVLYLSGIGTTMNRNCRSSSKSYDWLLAATKIRGNGPSIQTENSFSLHLQTFFNLINSTLEAKIYLILMTGNFIPQKRVLFALLSVARIRFRQFRLCSIINPTEIPYVRLSQ